MLLSSHAAGRIFGEVFGIWPPSIVALHGWGRDSGDFRAALSDANALALDLPGFGVTPPPATPWGTADYAKLVASVLQELPEPVLIVGHSFGGCVAVRLAASVPEQVGGLVLTGAPLIRQARAKVAWRFRVGRTLHRVGLLTDHRMERLRRRYGSADYGRAEGVLRDILSLVVNESYDEDLRAIDCPVELVWGGRDTAAPLEQARQVLRLVPHANLTVIPDEGHFIPLHAPNTIRAAIRRIEPTAVPGRVGE